MEVRKGTRMVGMCGERVWSSEDKGKGGFMILISPWLNFFLMNYKKKSL